MRMNSLHHLPALLLVCAFSLLGMTCVAQEEKGPIGRVVAYKKVGDRSLNLYVNASAEPAAKRAAIVFFHGGGWVKGVPSSFNPQSSAVAAHGGVAIEVEYRLLQEGRDDAEPPRLCVEDTKSALRWVRSHANELGIDPERIAAVGGSAGGYDATYAALVPGWDAATDDTRVSAVPNVLVLLNPVLDIRQGDFGFARFGTEAPQRSPLLFVNAHAPPTLILSGANDVLAKPASLRDFDTRMKAAGARSELIFYEGQGHGFFNREPYLSGTTAEMLRFLKSLGYLN
jgi:acetyl esterase